MKIPGSEASCSMKMPTELISRYLDRSALGLEPVYDLLGLHASFAAEISDLGLVGVGAFLERPAMRTHK